MARFAAEIDDATTGTTQAPGGGTVTPPPPGGGTATGVALTTRYVDINWTHTEPEPAGALQGFEVVLHFGTDPSIADNWIQDSIKVAATDRRFVGKITLRRTAAVYASVRALYLDGYTSAWVTAAASAPFTPDTVTYGDQGYVVFPDGTVMLWARGESRTADGNQTITWPVVNVKGVNYNGFPNACYNVQIVTINEDGSNLNDRIYQLISFSKTGCVVYGQGMSGPADGRPSRPLVTAWGF